MSKPGYLFLLRIAPRIDKWLIPRTEGRLSSMGRNKVGTLTTTGAKSGERRTQPLVMIQDGSDLLVIGSNYGRPPHPSWSANLLADPWCEVTFRAAPRQYKARLLESDERQRAWTVAVDFYNGYATYEKTCAPREIRVFRISPAP